MDRGEIGPGFAVLTGEQAAHARVLRLKSGDRVTLCDGQGTDYQCVIDQVHPDRIRLAVESQGSAASEAAVTVRVFMAFAKGDKPEHVIQKATELGAAEILLFPSSRCVMRLDGKSQEKKLARWQKIAVSAAEQSGRGRIPIVQVLSSYEEAVAEAARADRALFFYENEETVTLTEALREPFSTVSLMTGPEGGFEDREVEAARAAGMTVCSLGKRILRCETAPLCALSAVMFAAGEF